MGKLYIVGIGPGDYEHMTVQAVKALEESSLIVGYHVYVDLVKQWYPEKQYTTTPMTREVQRCQMALDAVKALEESSLIVGYHVYVDLVKQWYPEKQYTTTPMTREVQRCQMALDAAREETVALVCSGDSSIYGMVKQWYPEKQYTTTPMTREVQRCQMALDAAREETVALVCSGDSSIYGMVALVYELRGEENQPEIQVVPGLTAACSGGALLGAPLTHDFAVISLSDRLTPWELIEKRLLLAAQADLSMVLYNPASHGRPDHLRRACEILSRVLPQDRLCAVVRNIGREGQSAPGPAVRRGAQHWPGGTEPAAVHLGRASSAGCGYVLHRVCRKRHDTQDWRQHGDPQRIPGCISCAYLQEPPRAGSWRNFWRASRCRRWSAWRRSMGRQHGDPQRIPGCISCAYLQEPPRAGSWRNFWRASRCRRWSAWRRSMAGPCCRGGTWRC